MTTVSEFVEDYVNEGVDLLTTYWNMRCETLWSGYRNVPSQGVDEVELADLVEMMTTRVTELLHEWGWGISLNVIDATLNDIGELCRILFQFVLQLLDQLNYDLPNTKYIRRWFIKLKAGGADSGALYLTMESW